jgi:23S rRNA (adenine2503-C2)-methyltransferase
MTQDMTQDMTPALTNLSGLNRAGISAALAAMGIPEKQLKMRTQQVAHWMYHYGVTDITAMTNITKDLRAEMLNWFEVKRPEIAEAQISEDGTRKWLLRLADGHLVEAVYIPEDDRGTLCVSSQVGCTLTCKFCHTGTQRLVRNLTAQEIIQQVLVARDALEEWPSPPEGRLLSNIVFMGMGEPLYNFDEVKLAIEMMTDSAGLSMSRRRITLSTSGVVPEMERCGEETGVNLAVSLHAVNDEMRSEIMPINNKYPLDEVLKACASYPGAAALRSNMPCSKA